MWNRIAQLIIRFRVALITIIGLITILMGYYATKVEMSYDFARTVPPKDPDMLVLTQFREQFGEDGNVIAVGLQDSSVYQLRKFQAFRDLTKRIRNIHGVTEVVSLPVLKIILKDTAHSRFYLSPIFPDTINDQTSLDSLLKVCSEQRIYMDRFVNTTNGATMMLILVDKDVMNSSRREAMTDSLLAIGGDFANDVADLRDPHRVQSICRLVQNKKGRVIQQRGRDGQTLFHPQ